MPCFSKTRLVYWENKASTLTNANIATKIDVFKPKANASNCNYAVARVKGDDHNWHQIPTQYFGLYMTPAEMASLYENFDEFWCTNIKATIAHAIPIAKYPGGTNTTQLSFNNTIYSFTYNLEDTDNITLAPPAVQDLDKLYDLYRTFDGVSFLDGTRALLPRNDILYKIPMDNQATGDGNVPDQVQRPLLIADSLNIGSNTTTPTTDYIKGNYFAPQSDKYLKELDLVINFYPDFLQDNSKIKALYPGENQDVYSWSPKDNQMAKIDCRGLAFSEAFQQLDIRNYGMNSNVVWDDKMLLSTHLFPRSRGPFIDNTNMGVTSINERIRQFAFGEWSIDNMNHHGPTKWVVKGVPIVDDSNNIVNHSFMATCTWECTIEGVSRKNTIPRPLRWGHLYPEAIQYLTSFTNTDGTVTEASKLTWTKSWPKKPYQDAYWAGQQRIQRVDVNDGKTPAGMLVYPPIRPSGNTGWKAGQRELMTINNEEVDPNVFIQSTYTRVPSKAFSTCIDFNNPPANNTRAKRHSKHKPNILKKRSNQGHLSHVIDSINNVASNSTIHEYDNKENNINSLNVSDHSE